MKLNVPLKMVVSRASSADRPATAVQPVPTVGSWYAKVAAVAVGADAPPVAQVAEVAARAYAAAIGAYLEGATISDMSGSGV